MKKTQLLFTEKYPRLKDLGEELLLIYDEVLPKKSDDFKKWAKQFPLSYGVTAGESLKVVDAFPEHIKNIVRLCEGASSRRLTVVVVGGGSVGDFGGFIASILKRGVGLVHMPSTWLSAVDSAHGGKTALNVGSAKNQIGTFYPASKVILVKPLLLAQPAARTFEGFGELLKIGLIAGGSLWKKLSQESDVTAKTLWKYLESAIDAKIKTVAKDPEEKSGYRHILNLGHTVGHVFEVLYDLPHGIAINYGIDFALQFSLQKKILSLKDFENLQRQPVMGYLLSPLRDQLVHTSASALKEYRKLLLSDKKKTQAATLRFVFLKKPGQCVIKEVTVDEILIELCRQKEENLNG